jgi:hypothetical protein
MILTRRRRWLSAAVLALVAIALAVIYYTGDQAGRVAVSGSFTIDTTEPDSVTKADSLSTSKTSGFFAIDTRDPDTVTLATSLQTTKTSGTFTIDTRDADAVVLATSLAVSKYSPTFTIDTRANGAVHTIYGDFTIDTRDADTVTLAVSLRVSKVLSGFTIDTTEPPPEDSDNDDLHDLWERLYFGSVFASGPNDDPDGDGLSNFFEFATGTDPTVANAPATVELWLQTNAGAPRLFVRYSRHILATRMVKFEILLSAELQSWIDHTQHFTETGEILNGNGYVERITLVYPLIGTPPSRQFARLRLSRLP